MFAALAVPSWAEQPKLKVPNRIVLDAIRASDIVPGGPTISAGSVVRTVVWQGASISANLPPPDAAGLAPYVARPLVDLWSLRFNPNDDKPLGFIVDYRLTSRTGATGVLSHTTQPGALLTATVIERPPRIEVHKNGSMDVSGDAELRIDTSSVVVAGQYVGDLLITVNYL